MSVGVYKAGQGYWVRSLSAVFFGVLVLAAAAWGWQQAEAVDLPVSGYVLTLRAVEGDVAAGDSVDLIAITPDIAAKRIAIGTATATSVTHLADGKVRLEVSDLNVTNEDFVVDQTQGILKGTEAAPTFKGTIQTGGRTPIRVIPPMYLQAGVAGTLILVGAILIYWFIGVNHKTVDFLVATDGEMKKVNWSTKREIIGSTQVVIVAAFLIAGILFLIDSGFSWFFRAINVLEG